jgi:NAD(P)H-flavin reductase
MKTYDTIDSMAVGNGSIIEIRLEADGLSGRIACPPNLRPAPGQYLVACSADPFEPLPVALFPAGYEQGELRVSAPLPGHWLAGMELRLRGPLGNGFHMPGTVRRLALSCLDGSPARLLPLMTQALSQRAAVTVYARSTVAWLPAEVEVLPIELLPEAPAWADFLALDVPLAHLTEVRERLGLNPFQHLACQAQVLVRTAMPCSGLAECGICAVATRRGWALGCADGPVFDFNQLEWG